MGSRQQLHTTTHPLNQYDSANQRRINFLPKWVHQNHYKRKVIRKSFRRCHIAERALQNDKNVKSFNELKEEIFAKVFEFKGEKFVVAEKKSNLKSIFLLNYL
jgi:hypothetical protein